MATLNSHGMQPLEQAVMDAFDADQSKAQIAAALGMDRWQGQARQASQALLDAISRAHPDRIDG